MRRSYYVYILASRSRTLYVGVTNDLERRLAQHRAGVGSRFTRKYGVQRLVHIECASSPRDAIAREKQIKRWSRAKKLALVERATLNGQISVPVWFDDVALYRDNRDSSTRYARSE